MTGQTRRPAEEAKRFYEKALNWAESYDFPVALEVKGVDQEIAVLRIRLRTAIHKHPEDLELMVHGIALLVRALPAKYQLPEEDEKRLSAFAAETVRRLKERAAQGLDDE